MANPNPITYSPGKTLLKAIFCNVYVVYYLVDGFKTSNPYQTAFHLIIESIILPMLFIAAYNFILRKPVCDPS